MSLLAHDELTDWMAVNAPAVVAQSAATEVPPSAEPAITPMSMPSTCPRGCATTPVFPRTIQHTESNLSFGPVSGITQCLSCKFNVCINLRLPSDTSHAPLPQAGAVEWYRWGIITTAGDSSLLELRLDARVVCTFPALLGNHMRDSMRVRSARHPFPSWSTAKAQNDTILAPAGVPWHINESDFVVAVLDTLLGMATHNTLCWSVDPASLRRVIPQPLDRPAALLKQRELHWVDIESDTFPAGIQSTRWQRGSHCAVEHHRDTQWHWSIDPVAAALSASLPRPSQRLRLSCTWEATVPIPSLWADRIYLAEEPRHRPFFLVRAAPIPRSHPGFSLCRWHSAFTPVPASSPLKALGLLSLVGINRFHPLRAHAVGLALYGLPVFASVPESPLRRNDYASGASSGIAPDDPRVLKIREKERALGAHVDITDLFSDINCVARVHPVNFVLKPTYDDDGRLVPPGQSALRMVDDLTFQSSPAPESVSVNKASDTRHLPPIHLTSVRDIIQHIKYLVTARASNSPVDPRVCHSAGIGRRRGYKLDISRAYRNCVVLAAHTWMTAHKVHNADGSTQVFVDACFPFGMKQSTKVWTIIGTLLNCSLQAQHLAVFDYSDDFMGISTPEFELQDITTAIATIESVGLAVNEDKLASEGALAEIKTFLGVIVDVEEMSASLCPLRCTKLLTIIDDMLSGKNLSAATVKSLAHKFLFVSDAVPYAAAMTIELFAYAADPMTQRARPQVTSGLAFALKWWRKHLPRFRDCKYSFHPEDEPWFPSDVVFTDASGHGFGGVSTRYMVVFQGMWTALERSSSITHREAFAVLLAVLRFAASPAARSDLHSDAHSPAQAQPLAGRVSTPTTGDTPQRSRRVSPSPPPSRHNGPTPSASMSTTPHGSTTRPRLDPSATSFVPASSESSRVPSGSTQRPTQVQPGGLSPPITGNTQQRPRRVLPSPPSSRHGSPTLSASMSTTPLGLPTRPDFDLLETSSAQESSSRVPSGFTQRCPPPVTDTPLSQPPQTPRTARTPAPCLVVMCDNFAACQLFDKGFSSDPVFGYILRITAQILHQCQFHLRVFHVSGIFNTVADHVSRMPLADLPAGGPKMQLSTVPTAFRWLLETGLSTSSSCLDSTPAGRSALQRLRCTGAASLQSEVCQQSSRDLCLTRTINSFRISPSTSLPIENPTATPSSQGLSAATLPPYVHAYLSNLAVLSSATQSSRFSLRDSVRLPLLDAIESRLPRSSSVPSSPIQV